MFVDEQSKIIMRINLQSFSYPEQERERGNLPVSSSRDVFVVIVTVPSALRGVVGITRKPLRTDRLPSLKSSGTERER
jgi:hypothetical protein